MAMYYGATRTTGRKWLVTVILTMPEQSCLAMAESMLQAFEYTGCTQVLHESQLKQKNVLPVVPGTLELEYDAERYWRYKLKRANSPEAKAMVHTWAAEAGVDLSKPEV